MVHDVTIHYGGRCSMARKKSKPKGSFLRRNEPLIWVLIIAIPVVVLGVGYLVAPKVIWDQFLFHYYWAPIEADAVGHPVGGVTDAYNAVDTSTYGVILVLALFGIFRYLKRLDIEPGKEMFFATIPYILLGSVLRVLQDSGMFTGKATYLFISPIIYIFIGIVTLLKLVESHTIASQEKKMGQSGRLRGLWSFGAIMGFFNILYLIGYTFYVNNRELLSTNSRNATFLMSPVIVAVLSIAAFLGLVALVRRRGRLYIHDVFSVFGWHFLAIACFQALAFIMEGGKWPGVEVKAASMHLVQLLLVPLLALGVTALVAGIAYSLTRRCSWMEIYWKRPMNLVIMYAHLLDASATFTALQWFTYGEKHVLPNFLIGLTGTPAVMFPLKAIVIAVVLYVLDVEIKKDLEKNVLLGTLIRVAILVLGLAPGTRDLLRLAMGV